MPQMQQIILLEKVAQLGALGDLVKVKKGYARNFLIPSKKACRATPATIQAFEARRAELERIAAEKLACAQQLGEKLSGLTLQIAQKAGVDGRLFGSVTQHDIARALKVQDYAIEKAQIRMLDGPLKRVGDYPVQIVLHTDVMAEVIVSVLGESA
jgi:large subunit ribosomal protein L9